MKLYSNRELKYRNVILESQKVFIDFLNADIFNKLLHIFNASGYMKGFIENERKARGYDTKGITVKTKAYGSNKNKSTFICEIKKDNKPFIHLTIHLVPKHFNRESSGLIHISKNIYAKNFKGNELESYKYSLIYVERPLYKHDSLIFSVADDHLTTGKTTVSRYDDEINKEVDVIITVLNRLFDEDNKDYYIGDSDKLEYIHDNTNNYLKNINTHTNHTKRRNKGKYMYSDVLNIEPLPLLPRPSKLERKTQTTRKKTKNSKEN